MASIVFCCFLMLQWCMGQQEIEIVQEQKDNILTLVGKNNTTTKKFSVTLLLETTGYKITPPPPYEFVLDPGGSYEIVKLIAKKGESTSIGYQIKYAVVSGGQKTLEAKMSKEEVTEKLSSSDIIIFSKTTCEKCKFSINYLNVNHIPFIEMPLESPENSDLMWSALFNEGFEATTIATPIFAIKGKLVYNIEDLQGFLKGLEK